MTPSMANAQDRAIIVLNRLEAEVLRALINEAARRAGTNAHREGLLAISRGLTDPAGDRITLMGPAITAATVFSILSRARPTNESAAHLFRLAAPPARPAGARVRKPSSTDLTNAMRARA